MEHIEKAIKLAEAARDLAGPMESAYWDGYIDALRVVTGISLMRRDCKSPKVAREGTDKP